MSLNKEQLYLKSIDLVDEQIERYQGKMDAISGNNSEKKMSPNFDIYGNKGEVLNKYEQYAGYLDHAMEMKKTLMNLEKGYSSETVQPGSVVETKDSYYYISVPLGEINLEDGSQVFAISEEAPIYEFLKDKEAGDSFSFKGKTIEIVKVF